MELFFDPITVPADYRKSKLSYYARKSISHFYYACDFMFELIFKNFECKSIKDFGTNLILIDFIVYSYSTIRQSFRINKKILSSADNLSIIPCLRDLPTDLQKIYKEFNHTFDDTNEVFKIIVHTLPFNVSPAGFSIYSNYHEALKFLGFESYFTTDGNEVSVCY